jgi:tetratricopeptide (TPR) repeat protein
MAQTFSRRAGAVRIAPVVLLIMGAPLPLAAAVLVEGKGAAHRCHQAADAGSADQAALRQCDKALKDTALAAPDRAATLVNRGILNARLQRLGDALADYDAAIAAWPDSADAYVNRGLALVELGNRDAEAVAALSKGLALGPGRPAVALFVRAQAYESLGQLRRAYEDYARAAAIEPDWPAPAAELQRFQVVKAKTLQG